MLILGDHLGKERHPDLGLIPGDGGVDLELVETKIRWEGRALRRSKPRRSGD